jgi:hypothetical protein
MNATDTLLAAFDPLYQWLSFLAITVAVLLAVFVTFLWFALFRKKKRHHKRRHRRHGEQRKLNPTLAESGGLPPVREKKEIEGTTPP